MFKQTNLKKKRLWKFVVAVSVLLIGLHFAMAAPHWRPLAPGIDYQDVINNQFTPWSHIHTFKINLKQNTLSLTTAKEINHDFASADDYGKMSHALIAINGGFFDKNYQPLGLRIRRHQLISPFKAISWWGIFYTLHNEATITNPKQFRLSQEIDFGIQSGPRLIVNGKIPTLKEGRAERSALGITRRGHVIILVTEHAAMSTTELAKLMKAPPLNCLNAINLDGGSSSQLYANIDNFHLNVHGFSNVSDSIIVQAKAR